MSLPWPPTANTYWRHPDRGAARGRHLISREGRRYRQQVAFEVIAQCAPSLGGDPIRLHIVAYPPDRRRRDLDNLLKSVQDALAHAGIYEDDSQISDLRIVRGETIKPGRLDVEIEVMR